MHFNLALQMCSYIRNIHKYSYIINGHSFHFYNLLTTAIKKIFVNHFNFSGWFQRYWGNYASGNGFDWRTDGYYKLLHWKESQTFRWRFLTFFSMCVCDVLILSKSLHWTFFFFTFLHKIKTGVELRMKRLELMSWKL